MNDRPLSRFTQEEIKIALFQMFPTKSLGTDGFPAHFFQRYWEFCGEEVTQVVLRVLRGKEDPTGIKSIHALF